MHSPGRTVAPAGLADSAALEDPCGSRVRVVWAGCEWGVALLHTLYVLLSRQPLGVRKRSLGGVAMAESEALGRSVAAAEFRTETPL